MEETPHGYDSVCRHADCSRWHGAHHWHAGIERDVGVRHHLRICVAVVDRSKAMITETLRIAWCPSCQRYIGEPHMSRVVLVYVAKKHLKDYGHGVFLEACGP